MVMKLYLRLILAMLGTAGFCRGVIAADPPNPYRTYPNNTYTTPPNYAPRSIANLSSNAVMSALHAQASLLKELVQEHQQRASDLTKNNQSEKAKWETDLVAELQQRSAQIQKNIDQGAQTGSATNVLKAAGGSTDDQLVFESTLETRLEQVGQELSAAIEDSRVLSSQIATNKAPENLEGMTFVLDQNQRAVKELQREHLDLELRRLEFRAILKAIQK